MFVNAPTDDVVAPAPIPVPAPGQIQAQQAAPAPGEYKAGAMPIAELPPQAMGQASAPLPMWAKVLGGGLLVWTLWRYFR